LGLLAPEVRDSAQYEEQDARADKKPDGTDLHKLTDSPGDAHCTWSPDGKSLVFTSARIGFKDERALSNDAQPYGEIFVIQVDGTGLRQLTDNQWEDGTPMWFAEPPRKPASSDASNR
jgi:Tol biopolymer transport system component